MTLSLSGVRGCPPFFQWMTAGGFESVNRHLRRTVLPRGTSWSSGCSSKWWGIPTRRGGEKSHYVRGSALQCLPTSDNSLSGEVTCLHVFNSSHGHSSLKVTNEMWPRIVIWNISDALETTTQWLSPTSSYTCTS